MPLFSAILAGETLLLSLKVTVSSVNNTKFIIPFKTFIRNYYVLFLSREAFRLACLGHRGKVSWFRYNLRKKLRSSFLNK